MFGRTATVATQARDLAMTTSVELRALEGVIKANETARRSDLDEWRKGLGERLDQQDAAMSVLKGYGVKIFGWLLFGIISVLGTVTGLWLHSVGIIK